jgi:hypothetical protein|tara:strand:- start:165 stop:986 length:822 start_codon:yes stop_codon:yes gene_type:complete
MDESMKFFRARRVRAVAITSFVAIFIIAMVSAWETALHPTNYLTGWMLLTIVVFLSLYNVRKKLTYPPLFKASSWMQVHIYAGYLSVIVFFLHTNARLPNGAFEIILYLIFVLIALSGVFGLYLSRTIPARLTHNDQEVIYERIPQFIRQFRKQAQSLIIKAVASEDSTILEQFYNHNMHHFMAAPRNFWKHIFKTSRDLNALQKKLQSEYRYLNANEIEIAKQLVLIIDQKHDLDFHYALQKVLKLWLFVHIPLAFSLLVLLVVHLILVYAF